MGFLLPAAAVGTALTGADIAGATAAAVAAGDTLALTAPVATAVTAGSGFASTLSTVGTVASALSGVTGAIGSLSSAEAQKKAAGYQARVAQNNQAIAGNAANLAAASGESQVEQQGMKTAAEVGAIKAAQAASNIDVNTGSALDVRSSAAALGELDALTIRSNAEKAVYGYQTQGISYGAQAGLEQAQAAQAPVAGAIGATGSVLSGASGAANQYLRWQQAAGAGGGASPLALFS